MSDCASKLFYHRRYRLHMRQDDYWSMRLAEKIRAARLDLLWVRDRDRPILREVLRCNPRLKALIRETNYETGYHGNEHDLYWSVINSAFHSPVYFDERRIELSARA